jgi:hypothetical protein
MPLPQNNTVLICRTIRKSTPVCNRIAAIMSLRIRPVTSLDTLRRAVITFGCLLFLCSMVFPFALVEHKFTIDVITPADWDTTYFWSFRSSTQQFRAGILHGTVEYWFNDYWAKEYDYRPELLTVFVIMLAAQILTLTTGAASIFFNRKILAPVVPCLMTITLMVYIATSLEYWHSYQQGYWITYPSMFLFIIAFILSVVTNRKQTNT